MYCSLITALCTHQPSAAAAAAAAAVAAKRQTVPVPQCSEDLRLLRRCQLPAYLKFCEEVVFCNEDTAQGFAGIAAQHSGHLEVSNTSSSIFIHIQYSIVI
jgi:hypothetical protein